jgi:hypothetical protein
VPDPFVHGGQTRDPTHVPVRSRIPPVTKPPRPSILTPALLTAACTPLRPPAGRRQPWTTPQPGSDVWLLAAGLVVAGQSRVVSCRVSTAVGGKPAPALHSSLIRRRLDSVQAGGVEAEPQVYPIFFTITKPGCSPNVRSSAVQSPEAAGHQSIWGGVGKL